MQDQTDFKTPPSPSESSTQLNTLRLSQFTISYTLVVGCEEVVIDRGALHLLSAPPAVRLAHILRWFDRGDEFEDDVGDADDADHGAEDDVHNVVLEEDGAAEDVNYFSRSGERWKGEGNGNVHTPLPMKEKRKEA
jgi:hypothetical protein